MIKIHRIDEVFYTEHTIYRKNFVNGIILNSIKDGTILSINEKFASRGNPYSKCGLLRFASFYYKALKDITELDAFYVLCVIDDINRGEKLKWETVKTFKHYYNNRPINPINPYWFYAMYHTVDEK